MRDDVRGRVSANDADTGVPYARLPGRCLRILWDVVEPEIVLTDGFYRV